MNAVVSQTSVFEGKPLFTVFFESATNEPCGFIIRESQRLTLRDTRNDVLMATATNYGWLCKYAHDLFSKQLSCHNK